MKLIKAEVGKFRSINTDQVVDIDPAVTAFVGMNEAGKTVFLKALHKSLDAMGAEKFKTVDDYPRKDYTGYMKRHAAEPDVATKLTYQLDENEAKELNKLLHVQLKSGFVFSIQHKYNNIKTILLQVDEASAIAQLATTVGISSDAISTVRKAATLREAAEKLGEIERTDIDTAFLTTLQARIKKTDWTNVVQYELWRELDKRIPKFLYFSDYDLLPGKLNLADLAQKVQAAKDDPDNADTHIKPKHKAVLALLRMADVEPTDFTGTTGYEEMKAKIEAVSISLTDQVLEFWKQNEDLEVEVDIKEDIKDESPFNNGPNLYLRIKNRRHRGVSTPFDQRSRGFIWFFSFLVWFDSVQDHLAAPGTEAPSNLILLLDEPGLALHALAQGDFLKYIDTLAEQHQVLYTTHSPFMVHSDRLHQVRMVEDKEKIGTVISANLSGSDERTIFPLQAALGWTVAQNLFIGKRNILVEGPSELTYLQVMSALVEAGGGEGLRQDATIVPVGGLGNVVTFVSLLGANGLKLAILHDYSGSTDQRLDDLIRQKILAQKSVFNVSQYRDIEKLGQNTVATDIEDLFDPAMYIDYFNITYSKQLNGLVLKVSDLPKGDRIVNRIERWLDSKAVKVRPSGGFNHYAVAAKFGATPPKTIAVDVQKRFVALFESLNKAI
ncbi:AAA family ATPase [Variovorax sp. RKNM96]|uniref:AAA family ATPase n=1 Tax=Variovorax sp. RKNM96 TaxID=2681552 RepID=UPI0019809C13|nr:AAA family ATPase [Variovorax sp. RKNM96]QSI30445.1 AAA family ATPase [Variovorax sp. RKNM96]